MPGRGKRTPAVTGHRASIDLSPLGSLLGGGVEQTPEDQLPEGAPTSALTGKALPQYRSTAPIRDMLFNRGGNTQYAQNLTYGLQGKDVMLQEELAKERMMADYRSKLAQGEDVFRKQLELQYEAQREAGKDFGTGTERIKDIQKSNDLKIAAARAQEPIAPPVGLSYDIGAQSAPPQVPAPQLEPLPPSPSELGSSIRRQNLYQKTAAEDAKAKVENIKDTQAASFLGSNPTYTSTEMNEALRSKVLGNAKAFNELPASLETGIRGGQRAQFLNEHPELSGQELNADVQNKIANSIIATKRSKLPAIEQAGQQGGYFVNKNDPDIVDTLEGFVTPPVTKPKWSKEDAIANRAVNSTNDLLRGGLTMPKPATTTVQPMMSDSSLKPMNQTEQPPVDVNAMSPDEIKAGILSGKISREIGGAALKAKGVIQ